MKNDFDLSEKVVIVTGAAGLLGSTFSKKLSEKGAKTVLVGRNEESLENISKDLKGESLIVVADISKKSDVKKVVEKTLTKFGRIDSLVNNAAYIPRGDKSYCSIPDDYPEKHWDNAIAVNLTGLFYCCQEVGRVMIKQRKGSIVNIGSIYGMNSPQHPMYEKLGFNNPVVYGVTKAGVIQLTKYLGTYWAPKGVRVNCISPGGVLNKHDEAFLKEYNSRVPYGRMAKPEEVANAILFFCSDASGYITGQNLAVDGGWTSW